MKELSGFEQKAYDRLRETLGLSDAVDLCLVLSNANTRINRLQDTLDGKYNPEEAEKRLACGCFPEHLCDCPENGDNAT